MLMFSKLVEKITKENTKLPQSDPRVSKLRGLQEDLEFLNVTELISNIIKLKFKLWLRYKWRTVIFWMVFMFACYIGGRYVYNEIQKRTVYVRLQEQVKESKDSTIYIDKLINSDCKKYFDFIASTESKSYKDINTESNAIGRYQFIPIAIQQFNKLGVSFTTDFFLNHPEFQDVMMYIFLKENDKWLQDNKVYDRYVGKIINGYYISQSGLLSLHTQWLRWCTAVPQIWL